jgi:hypothetical protein
MQIGGMQSTSGDTGCPLSQGIHDKGYTAMTSNHFHWNFNLLTLKLHHIFHFSHGFCTVTEVDTFKSIMPVFEDSSLLRYCAVPPVTYLYVF